MSTTNDEDFSIFFELEKTLGKELERVCIFKKNVIAIGKGEKIEVPNLWREEGYYIIRKTSASNLSEQMDKTFYNNEGEIHRDGNLPAVFHMESPWKAWFKNGKRHRENNLPARLNMNGVIGNDEYWLNGVLHREGGPASSGSDGSAWYNNGRILDEQSITGEMIKHCNIDQIRFYLLDQDKNTRGAAETVLKFLERQKEA